MEKDNFVFGKVIKKLREEKGWTQLQVCKGCSEGELDVELKDKICSLGELSRIERGERRPHWDTFAKIMQRLGEDPNKYYDGYSLTKQDKKYAKIKDELKYLLREKTDDANAKAETLIGELEEDGFYKKALNQQFLFKTKATLAFNREDYVATLDYATKGIKISKADFHEDKIDSYILYYDEIALINLIAIAQSFLSPSLTISTNIWFKLKSCLDMGYVDEDEKSRTYVRILYNLAKNLGILKRYDECITLCNEGIHLYKKRLDVFYYPLFLINKGCSLWCINLKEEGMTQLKQAHAFLQASERLAELSMMEVQLQQMFGITIQSY